jgi:hypothetical protein
MKIKKQVTMRQHLTLPIEPTVKLNIIKDAPTKAAYIYALRTKGWTLQSVATALGVTRERIRQIETSASPSLVIGVLSNPGEFPVPELPSVEVEVNAPHIPVMPSEVSLKRLLELQPSAQSVRYNHSPHRAAAEEYTALLWHVHSVEGVTLYRLAKCLGVTHGALRFRLARYGYKAPKTGTSKAYTPIKAENRAVIL